MHFRRSANICLNTSKDPRYTALAGVFRMMVAPSPVKGPITPFTFTDLVMQSQSPVYAGMYFGSAFCLTICTCSCDL